MGLDERKLDTGVQTLVEVGKQKNQLTNKTSCFAVWFFCGIFPFILTYVKTKHYLELIVQGVNRLFFWRRITGTEVKTQGWRWAVMHELQTGLFAFSGWCCLVSYSNNWDSIRLLTKGKFTWAELLKKTHSTGCASERLTWPWYTFDTQHCKTRAT